MFRQKAIELLETPYPDHQIDFIFIGVIIVNRCGRDTQTGSYFTHT